MYNKSIVRQAGETARRINMLHITIKDTKSNKVIYDGEVSMVFMQAAEKDGIIAIRHTTEDASLSDVLNCTKTAIKSALDTKDSLSKAVEKAICETNFEKGETDE